MTLGQHQEKFARHFHMLLGKAFQLGYEARIGEAQRTEEQQEIYVRLKRSKTMNSMHLKKCAVDIYFTKNGVIVYPPELWDFWEKLDPLNQAGGKWRTFKDKPHFQRTV